MSNNIEFNKTDVTNKMLYELNLNKKVRESFDYVASKLKPQNFKDFLNLIWHETKNYNWCLINIDNITMIIRQYGHHFTFYVKTIVIHDIAERKFENVHYSIFTYYSNLEFLSNPLHDQIIDNPFLDLEQSFESMLEQLKNDDYFLIANSSAVLIPNHVEIKKAFNKTELYSIDTFIFALEELTRIHLELFAENDMIDILKKIKVGDKIRNNTVKEILINKDENDNYDYSRCGIYLKDEKSFEDVYNLTWYFLNYMLNYI